MKTSSARTSDVRPRTSDVRPTEGDWQLGPENAAGGVNLHSVVTTLEGEEEVLPLGWTSRVVRGGEVVVSDEEAKVNGRIMAASRRLLAAAHKALAEHEDAGCSCRGCGELRYAIDLAEGRR